MYLEIPLSVLMVLVITLASVIWFRYRDLAKAGDSMLRLAYIFEDFQAAARRDPPYVLHRSALNDELASLAKLISHAKEYRHIVMLTPKSGAIMAQSWGHLLLLVPLSQLTIYGFFSLILNSIHTEIVCVIAGICVTWFWRLQTEFLLRKLELCRTITKKYLKTRLNHDVDAIEEALR